ncbi:MAG: alpha-L-fucosidase [Kiritimatiellia bacterium]
MKMLLETSAAAMAAFAFCGLLCAAPAEAPYGVLPTSAHLDYHAREVIAIVHWGPNTYTGQEWGFGNVSPEKVTPDRLDPEQWVRAMADGGIRAVVLVCKHHDGFCLWPSPLNRDYSMSAVGGKYRGFDVVKATEKACRKYGLDFGAYLSPWDRRQASYATPAYVEYFHGQWDELMTKYGAICEIWLDGANGGDGWYGGANGGKGERRSIAAGYYQKPRLLARLHQLHPRAVAFGGHHNWSVRWCGNERGTSPETWWNVAKGDDGVEYWMPSEADTPFRGGWFFHEHQQPKPLKRLVDMYFESVGRGAVLNLGIAPDRHGEVCAADVKRLKEFGDYVRKFNAVDFAAGARRAQQRRGDELTIAIALKKPAQFNCVELAEPIELGQRIDSFKVEVQENGAWREAVRGTTVGYRRLARFDEVLADKVRVTVHGRAKPLLKPVKLRYAPPVEDAGARPRDLLPKKDWRIIDQTCMLTANADKAIDGDERTLWHTHPVGRQPLPPPQSFTVDCGKSVKMRGFDYVPRMDGCQHGMVDGYEFSVSDDARQWRSVKSGEIGNLAANPIRTRISFDAPVTARYFRFTATHSLSGNNQCCLAEIDLW